MVKRRQVSTSHIDSSKRSSTLLYRQRRCQSQFSSSAVYRPRDSNPRRSGHMYSSTDTLKRSITDQSTINVDLFNIMWAILKKMQYVIPLVSLNSYLYCDSVVWFAYKLWVTLKLDSHFCINIISAYSWFLLFLFDTIV